MHRLLTGALQVETLTVAIPGLPPAFHGLIIVQLSDLHADGLRLSKQLLDTAITQVNQLQPDLIVLTGDYVTEDPAPIAALATQLGQLHSRYGTYAVLGNHDLCQPDSQKLITQALEQANIRVLWDEIAYPFGSGLALVGLREYWSPRFRPAPIMAQLPPELPRIVLVHNPDSAQVLSHWRVDLQLSGHTHGGQIVVPGVGPVMAGVKKLRQKLPKSWRWLVNWTGVRTVQRWDWSQGLHRVGQNLLYVNRGLGTYLPGRFFCPPEITLITLVSPDRTDVITGVTHS
jgi:uncharacterized protein